MLWEPYKSNQIIATSHDLGPQNVAEDLPQKRGNDPIRLIFYR